MTHDDDLDLPELELLDEHAATAATDLRRHVDRHLAEHGQPVLPTTGVKRPRPQRRIAAVAAVAALLVGGLAAANRGDDRGQRVDIDDIDALPDIETGLLTPMGPRDGKDSIRLPITVEPNVELTDGAVVNVSGDGFMPGESVGIVQCAREAGGDSPETRGGADGCNIGRFEQVTADAQGHAAGTFTVTRVLTTPLTGTVDCAAEAQRCMVAMGAISDYDRSGGHAIEFAGGGEPIEIPTVTVTPTEGLDDGDVVHVVVQGVAPNDVLWLEVCSSDPVACWQTGDAVEIEHRNSEGEPFMTESEYGLEADWTGRAEGDVKVWRFLPGTEGGTYVDCAVSRCSLRINGETAPPTVPLHFNGGGEAPAAPVIAVDPSTGLAPDDDVIVRGVGFRPGSEVGLLLCAGPVGAPVEAPDSYCEYGNGSPIRVGDDGTFVHGYSIPRLRAPSGMAVCDADGICTSEWAEDSGDVECDDVSSSCWISVADWNAMPGGAPSFWPTPVAITFR